MTRLIETLEMRALMSGEVDASFGTNGTVTTDFDAFTERFTRLAAGTDGKIYAAGSLGARYLVARFTPDGRLDTTFNSTGYVQVPLTTSAGATAVAVMRDRVYVAGTKFETNSAASGVACVVALTTDGQFDTTFSGDGVWTGGWSGLPGSGVAGLHAYGDALYVAGNDDQYLGLAKLTRAGEYDTGFGTFNSGKALYYTGKTSYDVSFAVTGPNGVAPKFYVAAGYGGGPIIAAYNAAGVLDTNFNPLPFSGTAYGSGLSVRHMAVDASNRILLGGAYQQRAAVFRLSAGGNLDTSFANGGGYVSPSPTDAYAVSSLVALPSDRVLFTQATGSSYNAGGRVVQLLPDGKPNLSYAAGPNVDPLITNISAVVVQPDGKVVLAGRPYVGNDRFDTQLQRLNAPAEPTQISGYLFDDVNADGVRNDTGGGTTFYGITAYLDLNGNNAFDTATEPAAYAGNGKFQFDNAAPGTYSVRLHVYPGVDARQTLPTGNGGFAVTTNGPYNAVGPFGMHFGPLPPPPPTTYTVSGQVFVDTNKNKVIDGQEGVDGQLAGWYVYVDTNGNGGLDDGDTYITTTGRTAYNPYTLTLPADGKTYRVLLRNENAPQQPFTTAAYYDVSSSIGGTNVTGKNFGIAPIAPGASAAGTVFVDANKNGKQDAGEKGLADVKVYADVDNDKVLDANELWTVTGVTGAFGMNDLPDTGSATRLRIIVPAGYNQTLPANGYGWQLNLVAGATNVAKDFGVYTTPPPPPPVTKTAVISGFAFNDVNKNGKFDAGDSYAGGKTVWLDLDDDGKQGPGEATLVADSSGKFTFKALAAGKYHVRRVFPSGYVESTPARYVTLAAGQTAANVSIGSRSK